MKTTASIFLFFCLFLLSNTANAQLVQKGAVITVDKEVHDYGTIKVGSDGTCEFVIKNVGNEPLILSDVKGSCSCTVPEWPTEPIAPGKTAVIKVKYNTSHAGPINKSVTIMSNSLSNETMVVRIKGTVVEEQEGTSPGQ